MLWDRSQFNSEITKFTEKNSNFWKLIEVNRPTDALLKVKLATELYAKSFYSDTKLGIEIEFYIIYSTSYQVPVLYFLPFVKNINNISVAKIEDLDKLLHADLAAISLSENPINGLMMYSIHPCLTSKFMEEVISSSSNYTKFMHSFSVIESWLSFCPIKPLKSLISGPDFNINSANKSELAI